MQGFIKTELLNCLREEQQQNTLKKVCSNCAVVCSNSLQVFGRVACGNWCHFQGAFSRQCKYMLQVGDTVSGLAERIYDDSEWPELLPFLFECVQSNQPRQMESALRIFADLAGFIMPILLPHVNVMRQQLATCMSHPDTDVKIAGLSATTCFIRELEEDCDRNKFQDLIPVMLQTVSSILSTEEQESAEEALEAFIEIAEAHPTFLRRQLDVVVNNMLQA